MRYGDGIRRASRQESSPNQYCMYGIVWYCSYFVGILKQAEKVRFLEEYAVCRHGS